jgi:acid phosphatase family membrane protein YuiD
MDSFYAFFTNKILLIPFCSWFIAQFIKMMIVLIQQKRFDWRVIISSGGMPSSHAATVTALATAVGMTEGLGSTAFGITVILALIVMYDAAGVRQSVGQQAAMLNRIIDELRFRRIAELERDLREFIGHTQFQVFVGAVTGIIIAWLWVYLSQQI